MHPKHLHIKDFSYELPDEKIAKFPLDNRDGSKLLVYNQGTISTDNFSDIANYIPEQSLMVFNNTKVIHARLLFNRETGAQIEVLCLEPMNQPDIPSALNLKGSSIWKCMVGNAKKWNQGEKLIREIESADGIIQLTAILLNKIEDTYIVGFFWTPFEKPFSEVIHFAGQLPLPPYLKRDNIPSDEVRYQTIYAAEQGSIAAPTAGLHFTESVFDKLIAKQINIGDVTLHVGAGTFKPIKSDELAGHEMHEERISISLDTLEQIALHLESKLPITAVGTTVTRTLESLYWHGIKLMQHPNLDEISIQQWEPYETETNGVSSAEAIQTIIDCLKNNNLKDLQGKTKIIIAPGYDFKIVDILVTNFHQPENTLMLLVAAFVKEDWRAIYDYALKNEFRFLSYGDSSILIPKK